MNKKDFFEKIKDEFIKELVSLSSGAISEESATTIANRNLRPIDFSDNSPLQHKSVRWLAMSYLKLI